MNLQKMYDLANSKSYYSRTANPTEIWAAITEAGRRIHQNVCKEFRGYWIKTDTTAIVTAIGQDEYNCPIDLGQIIRFSERLVGETVYRQMQPVDITSDEFADKQWVTYLSSLYGPSSDFVFYGPYLDQNDALLNQLPNPLPQYYKVKFAPIPQDVRQTEIIYSARFVEMESAQAPNVIPMEGHGVMLDWAVEECLRGNNDSLAGQYAQSGMMKMTEFLTWVRSRQIYQYPTQEPYVGDLD